jgi:tRNA G18 (ribose-2'-O)-methylase SpoU
MNEQAISGSESKHKQKENHTRDLGGYFNCAKFNQESMTKFYSEQNIQSHMKSHDAKFVKKYSQSMTLGYCVLTLSICGNLNVGTIMRTAQLLGADTCIVFGKRKFDERSAVGATKYMDVKRVFGLMNGQLIDSESDKVSYNERIIDPMVFHDYLVQNNLVPVFLEQTSDAIYDNDVNWKKMEQILYRSGIQTKKFCFVFGNEGDGIAKDVLNQGLQIEGSFVIAIRQLGVLASFNVSASAAIILSKYRDYKVKQVVDRYDLATKLIRF